MVEHDGRLVGSVDLTREGSAGASLRWALYAGHRGHGHAARAVRVLVDWAFSDPDQGGWGLQRVEARIDPRNDRSRRVATRAGMRLEGMQRIAPGMGDRADATSYAVFARLATDPPLSDPEGFRSLLNSFLPRKRAISQMLVRDPEGRVLLCQLTYKRDWDLPGGVVEVGESPRLAVRREVEEELGLDIEPGDLRAHRLAARVGRLGRRGVPGLRRGHPRPRGARSAWSCRSARSATCASARWRRSTSWPPTSPPGGCGPRSRATSRIRSPVAEAGCLHDLGVRLRRGKQGQEGPPGRQGRQPGRDDQPRPAGPAGLHDLHRDLPRLPRRGRRARGAGRGGHRAPRGARGGDGQEARRRRRPAPGVGALGREVLHAGDDGDGPQRRAERHLGRRPGGPQRVRALRAGLLPPAAPDVRRHGAARRLRALLRGARRGQEGQGHGERPRPRRRRPARARGDLQGHHQGPRPATTSRRTRASRWTSRSAPSSTRGTPTARGSTAARSGSPRTSAPRSTCRPWSSATSAWTPAPASPSPATPPAARRASTATTSRTPRARTSSPASATPCPWPTWPRSTGRPTTT